jgi:hypothetical protein
LREVVFKLQYQNGEDMNELQSNVLRVPPIGQEMMAEGDQ